MDTVIDITSYVANAVCGVYFFFGFFACMCCEAFAEMLVERFQKWKDKRKEKLNKDVDNKGPMW